MLSIAMERTTPPKGGAASIVSTSLVMGAAELVKFDINDFTIKDLTLLAILPIDVIIGVIGILCPSNLIFDDEAAFEPAIITASVAIVGFALIDFDEVIAQAMYLYETAIVIYGF
jgi:hypothetical protein